MKNDSYTLCCAPQTRNFRILFSLANICYANRVRCFVLDLDESHVRIIIQWISWRVPGNVVPLPGKAEDVGRSVTLSRAA